MAHRDNIGERISQVVGGDWLQAEVGTPSCQVILDCLNFVRVAFADGVEWHTGAENKASVVWRDAEGRTLGDVISNCQDCPGKNDCWNGQDTSGQVLYMMVMAYPRSIPSCMWCLSYLSSSIFWSILIECLLILSSGRYWSVLVYFNPNANM